MSHPYVNNYEVETSEYLKHDVMVFQYAYLGDSEQAHVAAYYELCHPKGLVVDMGCGVGTIGHLLQEHDPSLSVINITNCLAQCRYMTAHNRPHIFADYHHVPLPSGSVDTVMFNESIGHSKLGLALQEASRLLKPNGLLLIKDFHNTAPDVEKFYLPSWDYTFYPISTITQTAQTFGLFLNFFTQLANVSTAHWQTFMARSKLRHWHDDSNIADYDKKSIPMLARFTKQ